MAQVKAKLKAARDALAKKDFQQAQIAASSVLDYDSANYNGHVFLALALFELGNYDESEQSYQNALAINKSQPLAWQGISKLYEKTARTTQYGDALRELMTIFAASQDTTKCAETYLKLLELRRTGSSKQDLIATLELLLPGSQYYPTLSQLPPPDHTNPTASNTLPVQEAIHDSLPILQEIVNLTEQLETEYLKKEVEKRRTRLGASPVDQLAKEVGLEIWSASKLSTLYNEILNHPSTSDDLRRDIDSRLLHYKQRYLFAIPLSDSERKNQLADQVDALAAGTVLLRIPDELAWMLALQNQDADTVENFDLDFLKQFVNTFPTRPLSTLIQGYFAYSGISLVDVDEDSEKNNQQEIPLEEAYDMIMSAFETLSDSPFAHLVLSQVFLKELDYSNAIKTAQNGLELLKRSEKDWGRQRKLTTLGFKVILATCFVHFYPPKHHVRALSLLDEVLTEAPHNITALMGRGYVLQGRKQWEDASALFNKASELSSPDNEEGKDDDLEGIRAREEAAWCQSHLDRQMGIDLLEQVLSAWDAVGGNEESSARCLWRIGHSYLNIDGQREKAYPYFIQALKKMSSYAPAFSSLGIYYSEVASPPDLTRSSKCFQKAFELDPREVEAARRLAEGFADEQEWDLVEVVARRTIEGEGGPGAGLGQSQESKFVTTNAWAWKAVGIVELIRRNYLPAIHSLQVALRSVPDDSVLWLRLGEAYSNAGRHIAAIKALERAKELGIQGWMCIHFLADLRRQIGQYQEAIDAFQAILIEHPNELGVLFGLAQTYFDQGQAQANTGFMARSELSFVDAIQTSLNIVDEHGGFRSLAWKIIADSLCALSSARTSFLHSEEVSACILRVLDIVSSSSSLSSGNLISIVDDSIVSVSSLLKNAEQLGGLEALGTSVIAYSIRKLLNIVPKHTKGSPEYDLGVCLLAWASRIGPKDRTRSDLAKRKGGEYVVAALQEDVGNERCWSALGTAKFVEQPKIAQHAYLKALEIDPKNVATWTSLGYLYLYHSDIELAAEAFLRAQTLDPDAPAPWVGHALVAAQQGKEQEYGSLLLQATTMNADMPYADLEYASHAFARPKHNTDLLPAFFVLSRYCKQRPDDAAGLHLFALVCESLSQIESAEEYASKAISILEAKYEETEDPEIENQFVIATANLGRLKLSTKEYEASLEAFESVLGLLLPNEADNEGDGSEEQHELNSNQVVLKIQCHFLSGVAHFALGNLSDSIESLENAIQTAATYSRSDLLRQVVVVLSQVLWTEGTEASRELAKDRLLECINDDPQNLSAITALVAMGILTDDESLIDAGLSEVLALPIGERLARDPEGDIVHLLIGHYVGLGQGQVDKAISIAQKSIIARPSDQGARKELATLMLRRNQAESATALLSSALPSRIPTMEKEDMSRHLVLRAVAEKMAHPMAMTSQSAAATTLSQAATHLCPSQLDGWAALAYTKSKG